LGHQSIAQAFGAKVTRAKVIMHGKTSEIHHDGSGVFEGLSQPFIATRYHSLVVEASFRGDSWEDLPPELRVSAWVDEAESRTVMGLEHTRYPTYGVQFHPESILTEMGKQILGNFLAKCGSPIADR
jgi:anthranilate synthase component 2